MKKKLPASLRDTYILSDDTVAELDETSLTGIMKDMTASIERVELERESDDGNDNDDGLDFSIANEHES